MPKDEYRKSRSPSPTSVVRPLSPVTSKETLAGVSSRDEPESNMTSERIEHEFNNFSTIFENRYEVKKGLSEEHIDEYLTHYQTIMSLYKHLERAHPSAEEAKRLGEIFTYTQLGMIRLRTAYPSMQETIQAAMAAPLDTGAHKPQSFDTLPTKKVSKHAMIQALAEAEQALGTEYPKFLARSGVKAKENPPFIGIMQQTYATFQDLLQTNKDNHTIAANLSGEDLATCARCYRKIVNMYERYYSVEIAGQSDQQVKDSLRDIYNQTQDMYSQLQRQYKEQFAAINLVEQFATNKLVTEQKRRKISKECSTAIANYQTNMQRIDQLATNNSRYHSAAACKTNLLSKFQLALRNFDQDPSYAPDELLADCQEFIAAANQTFQVNRSHPWFRSLISQPLESLLRRIITYCTGAAPAAAAENPPSKTFWDGKTTAAFTTEVLASELEKAVKKP